MKRQYYFIKIPNENILHSLNVCIGIDSTQIFSLDRKILYVKTNEKLIAIEESKGVERVKIFPKGLTKEYTYEQVKELLMGDNWQENIMI